MNDRLLRPCSRNRAGDEQWSFAATGLVQNVATMAVERFYIYRSGKTSACALTREKSEARLPPNGWQFWMQATRHQSEDGRYGFNWEAAVSEIATKGYYLFTGSSRLLDASVPARSATGPINA